MIPDITKLVARWVMVGGMMAATQFSIIWLKFPFAVTKDEAITSAVFWGAGWAFAKWREP